MTKLVPRLAALSARLQGINSRLGRPNFMTVVLEYPVGTYTVLSQDIEVTNISERQMAEFYQSGIQVNQQDLNLKGVPRTGVITKEMLQRGKYIIGATLNPTTLRWVGVLGDAHYVDDSNDTEWRVVVKVVRVR